MADVKKGLMIKIQNQLEKFSIDCNQAFVNECNRMYKSIKSRKPDVPRLNYLEIFKINKKEESYTRFLEWLLNPKGEHNLGTKPLELFLKNIVDSNFKFDLEEIKVKAEEPLKRGALDLVIKGDNFLCFVEIKVGAREGKDQTKKYYKYGVKLAGKKKKFFIYLTLTGEKAKCEKAWQNIKWTDMIGKVLKPLYESTEEPIKEILQMVIYSLQLNESENLVEFFKKEEECKKNKVTYYLTLKGLIKELNKNS
jgi:hypothetical protein